jgi:hypothetical protein
LLYRSRKTGRGERGNEKSAGKTGQGDEQAAEEQAAEEEEEEEEEDEAEEEEEETHVLLDAGVCRVHAREVWWRPVVRTEPELARCVLYVIVLQLPELPGAVGLGPRGTRLINRLDRLHRKQQRSKQGRVRTQDVQ